MKLWMRKSRKLAATSGVMVEISFWTMSKELVEKIMIDVFGGNYTLHTSLLNFISFLTVPEFFSSLF